MLGSSLLREIGDELEIVDYLATNCCLALDTEG